MYRIMLLIVVVLGLIIGCSNDYSPANQPTPTEKVYTVTGDTIQVFYKVDETATIQSQTIELVYKANQLGMRGYQIYDVEQIDDLTWLFECTRY